MIEEDREGTSLANDLVTVPNVLSLARLFLIPVAFFLYLYDHKVVAACIGIPAGATDIFDGILARKLNQATDLGAVLDRMSDLVLESLGFLLLILLGLVHPVLLVLYLFREFVVTSARMHLAEMGKKMPSGLWGTLKTDFLMAGFTGYLLFDSGVVPVPAIVSFLATLCPWLLWAGIVCSYISGAQYMWSYARQYRGTAR